VSTNPLRVLDSKDPQTQALLNQAPDFYSYLDEDSRQHFARLKTLLDNAGVTYEINPRLVRGLDYYCKTVFEWVTDRLGAQGTVCGGGRYDGLIAQLGGRPTPGVGWAMGVERLILMLQEMDLVPAELAQRVDVYMVHMGEEAAAASMLLAEQLRDQLPGVRVLWHCGGGSFKNQIKKADKSGAAVALIMGEDELQAGQVQVKPMRGQSDVQTLAVNEVSAALQIMI